jgi:hypothetical protein
VTPYKTKTQKKNALIAVKSKAFKLYGSGVLSIAQFEKINQIVMQARKKL